MITPPVEDIIEKARNLAPHEKASLIEALQAPEEPPVPRVSMLGKYKGCLSSVDEFLRRKHEDNEREDP
jgi:hypothetical protein